MTIPPTLGSQDATAKAHEAFRQATSNIFRRNQLGNGPRLNREQDKPAMLGTKHSASDTPGDHHTDAELLEDCELCDPLSALGMVALAFIAFFVLLIVVVIL